MYSAALAVGTWLIAGAFDFALSAGHAPGYMLQPQIIGGDSKAAHAFVVRLDLRDSLWLSVAMADDLVTAGEFLLLLYSVDIAGESSTV